MLLNIKLSKNIYSEQYLIKQQQRRGETVER